MLVDRLKVPFKPQDLLVIPRILRVRNARRNRIDFSEPEEEESASSISIKSFLHQKVDNPIIFDHKNSINRDNFASWLEVSFTLSQGQPMAQFVFMEWSRVNLGFDYRKSINNFNTAKTITFNRHKREGRWNFLSPEEQKLLTNRFKSVKRHSSTNPSLYYAEDERRILDEIQGQIQILFLKGEYPNVYEGFIPPNMTSLEIPFEEFKEKLNEYVGILRQQKNKAQN